MAQSTQNDASLRFQMPDPNIQASNNDEIASPRVPFRRQESWTSPSARYQHVPPADQDIAEYGEEEETGRARGLGLSNVPQTSGASVVRRKPISALLSPETSGSYEPLSQASTAQNTANIDAGGVKWGATPQSSNYDLRDSPYKHAADNVNLINHDHDHGPDGCPTRGDILKERMTWLSIMFIVLAVYSWVFSGVFLGIAVTKPRWGYRIGTKGAMSYDTATLLSALFSKTVELTFATSFVAVLGQILTRRAFPRGGKARVKAGISIAEMNMRLWIMQPGTLITHLTGARYVLTTLLGVTALMAAFMAAFYTTAAEALVSPKLKYGRNETRLIFGQVSTSYANANYLAANCETPITSNDDPMNYGESCLQVVMAGNGFRNMERWMSAWKDRQLQAINIEELKLQSRPAPVANLYDNTTVRGQWIRPAGENITAASAQFSRLVQNATIAMPHANVFHAARETTNRILQPNDLQGNGQYYLAAAVPAPALNALCVGASLSEIAPLVGNGTEGVPPANWPNVSTPIDSLFSWSQNPDYLTTYPHPWFAKIPKEFNTIQNTTSVKYGLPYVYLIIKPPNATITNDVVVCGIKSFQYSRCTTRLYEASSAAEMSVHCDNDPGNTNSYAKTINATESPLPVVTKADDWMYLAFEWIRSVSLTVGILDGNAAIARLLAFMVPTYSDGTDTVLDPSKPSIAEGLCVLAGYTLLMSSDAAPFVHYWDYAQTPPILEVPALESFKAVISYKDYSSGGDSTWKNVFYIILVGVFALNSFCLGCLLWYYYRYGEVTDYTEPQNLFALAINSPPSQILAGACGGGPSGDMLNKKWCVDMSRPTSETPNLSVNDTEYQNYSSPQNSGAHFYVRYPEEEPLIAATPVVSTPGTPYSSRFSRLIRGPLAPTSPVLDKKKNARLSMVRPKSMVDFEVDESPAVAQYLKLVGR